MEKKNIAVIGSGPAGIALGVEAARAGMTGTVILEKAEHPCDTVVSLYRAGKRVDSVYRKVTVAPRGALFFETETKESFLRWMGEVTDEYGLDIRCRHEVLEIKEKKGRFQIFCANEVLIEAPVVVIAIGIFGKPVKPSYRLPKEIRDRVHFSLPSQSPEGEKLLVVGGGDSAAEAACHLSRNNKVTLSYRRAEFFRINEPNLCSLNQCCTFENLETRLGVDIEGVEAAGERIKVNYTDGEEAFYDAVFYFLGGSTPRAFLEKAGVRYDDGAPLVDVHGESTVPRLFLSGDLVAAKGSIMTAFNSSAEVVERITGKYGDLVRQFI